jgi:Na+/proline symporter
MVFALVVPRLRTNGTVALAGTLYGLVLHVVNFLILTPLAFTVFQNANQPFELFAHMVFGTLLSFAFFGSGARRGEPVLAIHRSRGTSGSAPGAWSTGR